MVLAGYGYLDDPSFDGSTVQTYLIINRDSVSARAMLKATNTAGISGVDHADAQCANAGSDFEVVLNAAALPDDIYTLGLVLQYTVNGETKLDYIALPSTPELHGSEYSLLGRCVRKRISGNVQERSHCKMALLFL